MAERDPRDAATDASAAPAIPVARPALPRADALLPYLARIDARRVYSNFGPLALELEARIAAHLKLPATGVTSAGSGTAALVAAILATAGRARAERPYALLPSYTFVATAVAVEQCGYRPLLVDVDPAAWAMDAERIASHPALSQVGVVVAVAPYGRVVGQSPWLAFRERTGIEVAIDAAASFDLLAHADDALGPIPVALSFHATKSFGVGEGGAVVGSDADCIGRAARSLNFGFAGVRDSASASINGKLSEYHAAVGLAEFDAWPAKLAAFAAVAATYRRQFEAAGVAARLFVGPRVSACYALYLCDTVDEATQLRQRLERDAIDHRLWYGLGLHQHSYFRTAARDALPATESLAPRLLGLPNAVDLAEADVARIARAVAASA